MKKLAAILMCLMLVFTAAAEESTLCLVSPLFQTTEYEGTENMDGVEYSTYWYDDGMVFIETLTYDSPCDFGIVGEVSLSDLMELRFEGEVQEIAELESQPVSGYPTQRVELTAYSEEDTCVVDAVAVWTDTNTFVFIIRMPADAYYGFFDGYENGEGPEMIETWINSLEVFDGAAE